MSQISVLPPVSVWSASPTRETCRVVSRVSVKHTLRLSPKPATFSLLKMPKVV